MPSTPSSPTEYPRHIPSIPYTSPPTRLQTLDIWLPRPLDQSDPASTLWIIYIHGGAWRDPLQTSHCAAPTAKHLLSSPQSPRIAAIASLNYRLSPYASHPTSPSSPSDPARNATHPTHVRDISAGIAFLANSYGVRRWVGVGHSCGATMLSQYVSGIGVDAGDGRGPEALVLTAGIYNLPLFLRTHSPPTCPAGIAAVYAAIVSGAFGDNASTYLPVSPVSGTYSATTWPDGRLIVLAHSYEDELVERAQRDVMCVALDRQGWSIVMEDGDEEADVGGQGKGRRVLEVRDISGTHDFVWEDGKQGARLIGEVVGRLTR